jgi:uncharacterized protein (DUF58 family)
LLVYGAGLDWTLPGYGKLQLERILQALARVKPGESDIFESLEYVPTRLFPARSQLVVVSPLWSDDLPVLARLRAWGYQVLAVSPDVVAFESERCGAQPGVELAARIARLERRRVLQSLRRSGAWIVDWRVGTPLDPAVLAVAGHRSDWFRNIGMVERVQ